MIFISFLWVVYDSIFHQTPWRMKVDGYCDRTFIYPESSMV